MQSLKSEKIKLIYDELSGTIQGLYFLNDIDEMNWIIGQREVERYGFNVGDKFWGISNFVVDGKKASNNGTKRLEDIINEDSICFRYDMDGLLLCHEVIVKDDRAIWRIKLENTSGHDITLSEMYHWIPFSYITHTNINDNLNNSCSVVPTIAGNSSRIICRKRNNIGPNLVMINKTVNFRSLTSFCAYNNLFFSKPAPSCNGMIFHGVVNVYKSSSPDINNLSDWMYKDLEKPIVLKSCGRFEDEYTIFQYANKEELKELVLKENQTYIEYEPVAIEKADYSVDVWSNSDIDEVLIEEINFESKTVSKRKPDFTIHNIKENRFSLRFQSLGESGEKKINISFRDGTVNYIIVPVYIRLNDFIDARVQHIFTNCFIADRNSPKYGGYLPISRQGESCGKGSLILLANLLGNKKIEQIKQVEENTVHYIRKEWFDENLVPRRIYNNSHARLFDIDYFIYQFFLLSCFKKEELALNNPEVYLMWAYKAAIWRFSHNDKAGREDNEVDMPGAFIWSIPRIIKELEIQNYTFEHEKLKGIWEAWLERVALRAKKLSVIETEIYFDNAGFGPTAEAMILGGYMEEAILMSNLISANITESNDYRSQNPDRWWEAQAYMLHNLWGSLTAKASLAVYEATGALNYLLSSYKAMMPIFFNYDWRALSTDRIIEKGNGVSTYCVTKPNLNLEKISHNRFGQSIFSGGIFDSLDLEGEDWDLGGDMVAYLESFGQKTFVYNDNGEIKCVNGQIQCSDDKVCIKSFAAFPREYHFYENALHILSEGYGYGLVQVIFDISYKIQVWVKKYNADCRIKIKVVHGNNEFYIPDENIQYV